ncbi:hypothetical protein V3851_02225 [Paenibacillus sp. M1]|uniref:PsbP C-terminal domain-containing protein n=1 Tax=Paenibacillus haidiansis TaxID=1574488 RepID=A0ABU7VMP0_9BACL
MEQILEQIPQPMGKDEGRIPVKKFVCILIFALALVGCSNDSGTSESGNNEPATTSESEVKSETVPQMSYTTFSTDEFSVNYPDSWEQVNLEDLGELNNPLIKVAVRDNHSTNPFADNLSVGVEPNSTQETSAEKIAEITSNYFSQNEEATGMSNFQKLGFEEVDFPGIDAGIFTGEYDHSMGTKVVLIQYIAPTSSKVFTVSISLSKESYNAIGEDLITQVVETFEIYEEANSAEDVEQASANEQAFSEETLAADIMDTLTLSYTGGELDQKTYDYIVEHSELFPAGSAELKNKAESEVDVSITSRHLFKNVAPYLDKMVKVSGYVVQIQEEETDVGTIAEIHIMDENDNSIVGIYNGSTGDILDGDFVTMRGVPTSLYSFDNIGGGTTNAVLLAVSTVQITE